MRKFDKNLILFCIACFAGSNVFGSFAWERKANFGGGGREFAVAFSIGSYGYAGTGKNSVDYNDFWQYDPSNDSWTQKANYPGSGRYGMVGFSIGNYGYAGTGWSGFGGSALQYRDFWQYDPSLNSWIQKADFGGQERYGAVGFAIGNKGYVGLGYIPLLNDFWEYDPVTNFWTSKANFPGFRESAIGFGIGNKGYVGTGYNQPTSFNDFYEFDPVSNSWTPKSNMPGLRRRGSVAFVIGNNAYVGMGYNDTTYLTDFSQYNPVADQWTVVASIGGIPRYASFAFSINDYGYVGTGVYGGIVAAIAVTDFWRFEDCDGSPIGIQVVPNPHSSFINSFSVYSDKHKGVILDYDLEGEKDIRFSLYNSLGQLILSKDLISNTQNMNLSLSLSDELYFYSVTNNDKILKSGKILVN